MIKSVVFNCNSIRRTAGVAMPVFDYSKPCFERYRLFYDETQM